MLRKVLNGFKILFIMVLMMAIGTLALVYVSRVPNFAEWLNYRAYDAGDEAVSRIATAILDRDGEVIAMELEPEVILTGVRYSEAGGALELPINGATGWAAINTPLRREPTSNASTIKSLPPGQAFVILEGTGNWWYVELSDETGWVDRRACFINLPDVLPSMIYTNTNVSSSLKSSNGFDIPGISWQQLYHARTYNPRLGREEYIMPAKFSMALSLYEVQQFALAGGDTIILYEAFRPAEAQRAVVDGMNALIAENTFVRDAITRGSWNLGWFISTGVSNHQRGAAVDVSIGSVRYFEYRQTGDFIYRHILDYRPYIMPTNMHELSPWAAIVDSPRSISAAQILAGNVRMSSTVTPGVMNLQTAFAYSGFTPLASEWWHFNHPPSVNSARDRGFTGNFHTETVYSRPPVITN